VMWSKLVVLGLASTTHGFSPAVNQLSRQSADGCTRSAVTSMKVFAWKERGTEPPALSELTLGSLKASPGSNKPKTRKGRGVSAGQGVTCGFGNRGQNQRSGKPTRPGFEGGQIPLVRRLPKFVGRPMGMSHSKTEYGLIKLSNLNGAAEGSVVDYSSLQDSKAVSKSKYKLKKVVSSSEPLTVKGLTVRAHAFTAAAKASIEANGGTCVTLSPTTGLADGETKPEA